MSKTIKQTCFIVVESDGAMLISKSDKLVKPAPQNHRILFGKNAPQVVKIKHLGMIIDVNFIAASSKYISTCLVY